MAIKAFGYKSIECFQIDKSKKISAVISVSGQNIISKDIQNSFEMKTIGRYDYLSQYEDITWGQLFDFSKQLHKEEVIASRVHIGCSISNDALDLPKPKSSPLYNKFVEKYKFEIKSIDYEKLTEIYSGDSEYVASIQLMLNEIGVAIKTTLQRGFSKYNSICYIEPYLTFIAYIREKIIKNYCEYKKENADSLENDIDSFAKKLANSLVDTSNSFYKSILTLDSSIMHNERRFIISDPYQLTLFDIPPKLIAYYTAIASKMAEALNIQGNRYVFLITPDIKKDMHIDSITENRDIGEEINILIIHINEKSIYNLTETTKSLAHEIAHHAGQDEELRKIRAQCYVKCYIALLVKRSINCKKISVSSKAVESIEKIIDEIYQFVNKSNFFDRITNYYYMDELINTLHIFIMDLFNNNDEFHEKLFEIISDNLSEEIVEIYLKSFNLVSTNKISLNDDLILNHFIYMHMLNIIQQNLSKYFKDEEELESDLSCISFVFREGYADLQMILLTEKNVSTNLKNVIDNYLKMFENVRCKTDEMMRTKAVQNAFLDEDIWDYSEFAKSYIIGDDPIDQAYYSYICKQATKYFKIIRDKAEQTPYDLTVDSFLFKKNNTNEVIRQVDDIISSYVEKIVNLMDLKNESTL